MYSKISDCLFQEIDISVSLFPKYTASFQKPMCEIAVFVPRPVDMCMDQHAFSLVHAHARSSLRLLAHLHTAKFAFGSERTSMGIRDSPWTCEHARGHEHRCANVRACLYLCAHACKAIWTHVNVWAHTGRCSQVPAHVNLTCAHACRTVCRSWTSAYACGNVQTSADMCSDIQPECYAYAWAPTFLVLYRFRLFPYFYFHEVQYTTQFRK